MFFLLSTCHQAIGASKTNYTIAVIPKGNTHEFWKSIHAGAAKAAEEFNKTGGNVRIIWKGPLKEDDRDQQIQVVENFVGQKVSGIVLAPLDSQALVAPVETAVAAKIPVVIIDSGLNSKQISSFVATDNFKGGQLAGENLGQLLGGKGKVILLRYQVGSASTEQREAGFLDAMKSKYPGIQIVSSDQHAGATRDTAYQAAQNVLNRFGKDLAGVFTPNESSTVGMNLALKDLGKAGVIKHIGFDSSLPLMEALEKKEIQGLVLQDPMNMGYLGVKTMLQHLSGDKVPERIDTGLKLITFENFKTPEIQDLIHPPLEKYLK